MENGHLTNNDVKTILENHHTGLVLLMPGSSFSCPGNMKIASRQTVQFGMNGCHRCMMLALRQLMEKEPDFKRVVIDALSNKIP